MAAIEQGRARVHEDPRPQARAAAEVGHRGRLARRSHVGRLRRRLPPRADPRTALDRRTPELRARLLRRASTQRASPSRSQRAKPALETCLDYSVKYQYFDELLAQLRGVAREELQVRIPRRRRAPRSADALEQRSRREGRRRSSSAARSGTRPQRSGEDHRVDDGRRRRSGRAQGGGDRAKPQRRPKRAVPGGKK